ncbi:RpiB/LacA/LacB family sugar-phosphate isomerase [Candidatus Nomurabacteria bacterium]|nr:RpiB/LacA/LacB family sugar-phosphate isomerase [Candidatus Kaiserbacteria bacterium]MCB9814230.1 RpiB/LacA/LacB family sugar-phosphate isomerase [Candidatus Nomurabacteria bacterium]
MVIHLATDHAGFVHKEAVSTWLKSEGYTIVDHGAYEDDPLDDYPYFISLAAAEVSKNPAGAKAIVFGGSGQGEAMVANRFPNVRATVYYGGDEEIISLSRQHNDANVLSIGARFVDIDTCKKMVWKWLHTDFFTEEKYQRRNKKISVITKKIHT